MQLSSTRWALPSLAVMSFTEASFFPLIPDVLLAPMVLARRERAWLYAAVCSLASVAGALLGYGIGVFLEPVARQLVAFFGHGQSLETYKDWYGAYGFWVIIGKGFTPIPFKLVTITSGVFRFNLAYFMLACALTRSARFFAVAALLQHPKAKAFVDKHLVALCIGGVLAVVLAVAALKFL
jgi:membrane protein YqaA with SNARE-associated domain